MRAHFLIAIICLSVVQLPVGSAQIPTAAISLTCDSSDNVSHLYQYSLDNASNASVDFDALYEDITCVATNPTAYIERVAISADTNFPIALTAPSDIVVGGNSETSFSVLVDVNLDFISNYNKLTQYWLSVNASVQEISGLPPANVATSSHIQSNLTLSSIVQGSKVGLEAPFFSGDIYDGSSWRSFNSDSSFDSGSTAPFSSEWMALQFIDLNCPSCMGAAGKMKLWNEQFSPLNSTEFSPNVEILTSVSKLINPSPTYDFEVSPTGTTFSTSTGEAVVYVSLDAGEDLSWSTVIVQMKADGGVYVECTNPDKVAGTGCGITDNDDGKWAFGEEVTISEGSDDTCSGGVCEVQIKILDRSTNSLIWESGTVIASGFEQFSTNKSGIEEFRDLYNHTHSYIDDLDNDNLDSWGIQGVPQYSLIQPNGIVAWDSSGQRFNLAWSESQQKPIILDSCFACELDDAIMELVDVFDILDSDGDGVPDADDVFPYDSNETADSDGDGVGDNEDAFPNDENETHDDDSDGVGNNSDAFPQDGNETNDDDGDGVGNNTDAFPQDANETIDTDGDGVGDNADPEPENPDVRTPQDINVEISDQSSYLIAGAIVFLGIVILFVRRKQPPVTTDTNFVEDDSIWNDS